MAISTSSTAEARDSVLWAFWIPVAESAVAAGQLGTVHRILRFQLTWDCQTELPLRLGCWDGLKLCPNTFNTIRLLSDYCQIIIRLLSDYYQIIIRLLQPNLFLVRATQETPPQKKERSYWTWELYEDSMQSMVMASNRSCVLQHLLFCLSLPSAVR